MADNFNKKKRQVIELPTGEANQKENANVSKGGYKTSSPKPNDNKKSLASDFTRAANNSNAPLSTLNSGDSSIQSNLKSDRAILNENPKDPRLNYHYDPKTGKRSVIYGGAGAIGLLGPGAASAAKSAYNAVKAWRTASKAKKLANIGKLTKTVTKTNVKTGVTSVYKYNTLTEKKTMSMLQKIGIATGVSAFGVSIIKDIVGTYPFAAFLGKEEAPQTLDFALRTAITAGDFEGEQQVLDMKREILSPEFWNSTKDKIPHLNTLKAIDVYVEAAQLKLEIDQKSLDDRKIQAETGESDSDMYARIAVERKTAKEQERIDDKAFYDGIATKKLIADETKRRNDEMFYKGLSEQATAEAKKKREEDQKFWDKINADKEKRDAEKRVADEQYWNAYYRNLAKIKEDTAPSKLQFGLI